MRLYFPRKLDCSRQVCSEIVGSIKPKTEEIAKTAILLKIGLHCKPFPVSFAQFWSCFSIRMIQEHPTIDCSLNQKELNKIRMLKLSYKNRLSATTWLLICFHFNNCQIAKFMWICKNLWRSILSAQLIWTHHANLFLSNSFNGFKFIWWADWKW